MRISLNNVWLTNDGLSDLRAWSDAHDARLNGRQLVQDAQFLRAVAAQPLARGNAVNELQFTVTQQHATVAAAAAFTLTAFSLMPTSGTAAVVCGAFGESPVTCTFTAVLEAMPVCTFRGTRTDVTYVLRGGAITAATDSAVLAVDGASFNTLYNFPAGGSLDGGNLADALSPTTLNLDGGALIAA
jgi:hypothetical protein